MTPAWLALNIPVDRIMEMNTTRQHVSFEKSFNSTQLLLLVIQDLNVYYVPFVLAVGLLFHTACCLVFTRTLLARKFFTQLFLGNSVADLGFLVTLLLHWVHDNSVDIYVVPGMCPVAIFLSHFFPFLSFWTSMAASSVVLLQPAVGQVNKFARGADRGRIVVVCTAIIAFTVYLYKTWINGVIEIGGRRYCTVLKEARDAIKVLNVLDVMFLLLIPFIGFLIFDVIVILRHIHFYWQCQRRIGPRMKIAKDAMKVIVSQSVCFIMFVGPGCVSKLVFYVGGGAGGRRDLSPYDVLLQNVFQYLFYTYFAVVPLAHIIVSSSFRTHAKSACTACTACRPSIQTTSDNMTGILMFQTEPSSQQTLL